MADVAGLNLNEPQQIDYANLKTSFDSKFRTPPPAEDANGNRLTYYGEVPKTIELGATSSGDRQYTIDPIKITRNAMNTDEGKGYECRFARVNTKMWVSKKTGEPLNLNSAVLFLKAAGSPAKPQRISEYDAAVKATAGRQVAFTLTWEARNKDTGETVKGYRAFPIDPARPGHRKSVLKQGDTYYELDQKGNVVGEKQVVSEVLFANAVIDRFIDQTAKK